MRMKSVNIDDIPASIIVTTPDLVVIECNTEWEQEFRVENKSSLGRMLNEFATPSTRIFLQTHIIPTLLRDGAIKEIYVSLLASSGREVPVFLNARIDNTGEHQRFIWSIFSSKQRRKLERELLHRKQAADEMNLELERVASELKRSNEALVSFTSIVTHDLKAPARHFRFSADLLEMELEGQLTIEASELLSVLKDGAENMSRIIDDLHRYSLVGTNHGEFDAIEVAPFLEAIVRSVAPDRSFKFTYEGSVDRLETLIVPFELVVRNLINNAIKHHHRDDGIISASIIEEGNCYRVDIADDGPGIASDYHDVIFGEFRRLPSDKDNHGSGLGLAMVKRTVENYGGQISVTSDLGKGAKFSFIWPLEKELKHLLNK